MNTQDSLSYFLFAVVILFVVALLTVALVQFFGEFTKELKYINTEIRRTDGRERKHWKKQKRKLWLSLLPFYRY